MLRAQKASCPEALSLEELFWRALLWMLFLHTDQRPCRAKRCAQKEPAPVKLSKKKKKKNYTVESFRPNGKHCLGRKEFLEQYGKSCFLLWNPQEMKKKISKKKACHIQKSKGKKCGWTIEKRERFSDLACPNAYLLLERNDLSLSLHFAELIKLLFCWASYNQMKFTSSGCYLYLWLKWKQLKC